MGVPPLLCSCTADPSPLRSPPKKNSHRLSKLELSSSGVPKPLIQCAQGTFSFLRAKRWQFLQQQQLNGPAVLLGHALVSLVSACCPAVMKVLCYIANYSACIHAKLNACLTLLLMSIIMHDYVTCLFVLLMYVSWSQVHVMQFISGMPTLMYLRYMACSCSF